MTSRLFHLLDGIAVILGSIILVAAFANLSTAEAATSLTLLTGKSNQPLVALFGFTLGTFPVSRRIVYHALMANGDVKEYQEVGHALQRLALMQRVQAGNLYLAHMDDCGIRNVFDSEQGLWDWLGPAYEDPALRRQLHPDLLLRLETLSCRRPAFAQA